MANIISQAMVMKSLDDTTPTIPATFHKFGELPAELRLKIFKMSLNNPRRIVLMRAAHRPKLSFSNAALLLVNWEANQLFREKYTKCFHELGQKGIYINFDIDTLCFKTGTKSLRKMVRQYPRSMSKVKFIDVKCEYWRNGRALQLPMDLTVLRSLQKLTIRWNLGEYQRSRPNPRIMRDAFAYLTVSLKKAAQAGTWKPSNVPKAALIVVFGDSESWSHSNNCLDQGSMYLETGVDLTSASYGRIREEDDILLDFQVDWIEQDVPLDIVVQMMSQPGRGYMLSTLPMVKKACDAFRVFMSVETQKSTQLFDKKQARMKIHAAWVRSWDKRIDNELARVKIHAAWVRSWNKQINASPAQIADSENVLDRRRRASLSRYPCLAL